MSKIIDKINQEQLKKDATKFNVGDSVRVHTIVKEGDKERIQIFTGIVIARKGTDINADLHRPPHQLRRGCRARVPAAFARASRRSKWRTSGSVRRAKLNYLRNRTGKAAMAVKDKEREKAEVAPAAV